MNNHFISRSLTEYWEYDQRKLQYYSFKTGKFHEGRSKRLFAREDIYSKKLEDFLGRYIETPIGKIRSRMLKGEKVESTSDWSEFRALYLLILMQAPRYSSSYSLDGASKLELLAEKGPNYADEVVGALMSQNQILQMTLDVDQQLFFPEVGFFPFYTADDECVTGFSFGFGVPIHPRILVGLASKSANVDYLNYIRTTKNILPGLSLSTSRATEKVILTKETLEIMGEDKLKEILLKWRDLTDQQISNIEKIRINVQRMYQQVGLPLHPQLGSLGGVLCHSSSKT